MESYSIAIKFYGKIPIHLAWNVVKEENGKDKRIQSF